MLHSFSRNHHHHHHYFKYNRIKGKEDLDGRTQIQIYTNKIHVNTLRIFEVVHLWIILNRFIIGVHARGYLWSRWVEQRAIPHWPNRGRSQINRTFAFARDSPLSEGKWSKFNWYARIFDKSVMIISFRNWMKYIDV